MHGAALFIIYIFFLICLVVYRLGRGALRLLWRAAVAVAKRVQREVESHRDRREAEAWRREHGQGTEEANTDRPSPERVE